jgi:hypothetical protein
LPAFQTLTKGSGIGVGEGVAVEDNGWSEAAGTDAARGVERSVGVGCSFTGLNAQSFFGGSQKRWRAFDVAGGAHADEAAVFAWRLKSEEVVKGGNSVGLAERDAEGFCNETERRLIEIAEGFLNGVKCFNEGIAREAVAAHGAINDTPSFVIGRERGFLQSEGHETNSLRPDQQGPSTG